MIDPEKCQITHYPAEVLTSKAQAVEQIDDTVRQLVEKMTDIMLKNKGVGLAAPQAGVPLRLFIISLDGNKDSVKVFINPTVTPIPEQTGSSLAEMDEGCLSVPGIYTKIRRYKRCKVTATDLNGNEFSEETEGLYARALQHEYDHIEGMTIASRMSPTAKIAHRKRLKALADKQQETKK